MLKTMHPKSILILLLAATVTIVNSLSCKKENDSNKNPQPLPPETGGGNSPLNLPATPYDYVSTGTNMQPWLADYMRTTPLDNTPANNPITNAGATLGRVLFYDKSLSVNNTIACASCHHQANAFSDVVALSKGFEGNVTRRNAMPVTNLRFFKDKKMFWDFRAGDIETQTLMPITDHIEMGMPDLATLENKLSNLNYYPALFNAAFGSTTITSEKIGKALSQFMRSIVSLNSKYDKGVQNNFANFTPQELEGLHTMQRDFCTECHSDLWNSGLGKKSSFLIVENTGVNTGFGSNDGLEEDYTDKGYGEITHEPKDQGTFKIPSLRNVVLTAPYMHDGRFTTLEQVLEHYDSGIKRNPALGIQLVPGGIPLSATDKANMIAFMKTLTDEEMIKDVKYSDPFKK
jgi:cytochrome c peroxidase